MLAAVWRQFLLIFLAITGVTFLLNAAGVTHISLGDAILGILTLLFLPAVFSLLRRRRTPPETFQDKFFGRIDVGGSPLAGNALFQVGVGTVLLDLAAESVWSGEHEVTVNGIAGKLEVRVPQNIGLSIDAEVMVGSLSVLGRGAGGVLRRMQVTSPEYGTAPKRLRLTIELAYGEILVSSIPS